MSFILALNPGQEHCVQQSTSRFLFFLFGFLYFFKSANKVHYKLIH